METLQRLVRIRKIHEINGWVEDVRLFLKMDIKLFSGACYYSKE